MTIFEIVDKCVKSSESRCSHSMLGKADTGTMEGRETWCVYVLSGMLDELVTAKLGVAKASVLKHAMPALNERQRTYQIGSLVERGMLAPIREGARQHTVGFANNILIRGVIRALSDEGFIPDTLDQSR